MKNIHILKTDKPSTICKINNVLVLSKIGTITNDTKSLIRQNIYITSDEKIKEGDWFLNKISMKTYKNIWDDYSNNIDEEKIILTTDQDLIKDGVQEIDDTFLEWFVKNPSCKEVEVVDDTLTVKEMSKFPLGKRNHKYKIIISKEEPKQDLEKEIFYLEQELDIPSYLKWHNSKPKQETLEEILNMLNKNQLDKLDSFLKGANWQKERMYSEEEAYDIWKAGQEYWKTSGESKTFEEFIEQFKNK